MWATLESPEEANALLERVSCCYKRLPCPPRQHSIMSLGCADETPHLLNSDRGEVLLQLSKSGAQNLIEI